MTIAPAPATALLLPPILTTADGRMRTVGIEIEFVGPSAEAAARALMSRVGGLLCEDDPHAYTVRGSRIGDFCVALDSRLVHPPKGDHPLGSVLPQLAAWFGSAASALIPCELVTAPIPIDRLGEIDPLV